ncbi:20810_t:CDS:2 [Dentiscutata erythropus]|uniref:20810_t:CDS:1 n=1 Tax=Dentiscutata erythropus TaxID=1348616 RepID=A0A9N8ZWH2_9GLOM|nr:20810_t:CDS:2 [Dentiscutata erythropus]
MEGQIVNVKFDFTEELLSVTYNRNEQYNGTYLDSLYLTGSLPTSPTSNDTVIPKCKEIVITCESHDQGWSSYPQDNGTYNNSWTWGEISIITSKQNNNLQDQLINYEAIEKQPKTRFRVYTNKHADKNWQVHKQEFFSDHPLVQSLQPGDIVGLWIRSDFPGWCNYIKRAEIKFYYTI